MAWFECTTGASSGNGVALIVTTDASFAGSNITASNGEDTFTQQCPSSAPYVVTFENIPTGTYTISGVTGGQTVSKTFVVSDYNFEFHNTPTGSTATPVNVIQTWLHCANIWNKSYTTINQVLADTSTLLALISSNNAADYMARSTNWASSVCANQTAMGYIGNNNYCANKLLANSTWLNAICNSTYFEGVLNVKVPTMTSNTTPQGQAFGSTKYDNNTDYYKAFDGVVSQSNEWASASGNQVGAFIGYQFTKQVRVLIFEIYPYGGNENSPSKVKLQGYNGSSWGDIGGEQTLTQGQWNKKVVSNNNTYSQYRLYVTAVNGATGVPNVNVFEVQFYGR